MGILCQINLFKPPDGAYLAGSVVSGVIKYGVDEVTVFDKITVSLKGHGTLVIHDEIRSRKHDTRKIFRHNESYVDVDNVTSNEKKVPHEIGMYEKRFDFKLSVDIPPTFHYCGRTGRYRVKCDIKYYIRIKFERPGFLQFAKRFRKEITVISRLKPKLINEPVIYGEQKKLFQLFSSKNSIVNVKANIRSSVISPGGKIDLDYEIWNDTNITVKGVKAKLVEIYTFTSACGREVKISSDVENTEIKTGSIKSDEKRNFDIVIDVPSDKATLGFSSIVSRNYIVRLTAALPFPHINAVLEMPVEIGDVLQEAELDDDALQLTEVCEGPPDYDNPPPSYWEAMGEETKDDEFSSEKSDK